MRYLARAVALGGLAVGVLGSKVAAAETVAVVTASPNAEAAARYLATQTEFPVVRRKSANARDLDALMSEARARWDDELVVVLDTDRALVSVVRPGDGTVGSRRLDPSAASAPYVVALAAAELMEIVRDAPPARAAALAAPEKKNETPVRFVLGASVLQTVSVNGDVSLVRPSARLDAEFPLPSSPWWLGFGVEGTGLVPMHRDEVLVLPAGTDDHGSIEYLRNEAALHLAFGERQGRSDVSGFCDVGLAFVDAEAKDQASEVVAKDRRTAVWFGLGAELQYTLWAGLSLGVVAGAAFFPATSRFYTSPAGSGSTAPAFSEGKLELRAGAGLAWTFGS